MSVECQLLLFFPSALDFYWHIKDRLEGCIVPVTPSQNQESITDIFLHPHLTGTCSTATKSGLAFPLHLKPCMLLWVGSRLSFQNMCSGSKIIATWMDAHIHHVKVFSSADFSLCACLTLNSVGKFHVFDLLWCSKTGENKINIHSENFLKKLIGALLKVFNKSLVQHQWTEWSWPVSSLTVWIQEECPNEFFHLFLFCY